MQVFITRQAQKQFKNIPQNKQQKIREVFSSLAATPLIGKPLKGQLEGKYSIRCWPYRIIYQIDGKNQQVFVLAIIHRQGAYT